MKKLLLVLFLFVSSSSYAQLHIGIFGDANKNLTDFKYMDFHIGKGPFLNTCSGGGYLSFTYDVKKWISVRMDLEMQIQRTQNNFFYTHDGDKIAISVDTHTVPTVVLPIMGGVYYEVRKWRFHEYVGLYGMYSRNDIRSLKNLDCGFVNCAGIGYKFCNKWTANVECKYYRGFLDVHNTGSIYYKQPIYNQLVELAAGVSYTFNFKK